MANKKQIEILKKGVALWNQWRIDNPSTDIDLSEANFEGRNLNGLNLQNSICDESNFNGANLVEANLEEGFFTNAKFRHANLELANLRNGEFTDADFSKANLRKADLEYAKINRANFRSGNLEKACLRGTDCTSAIFSGANLVGADLFGSNQTASEFNQSILNQASFNRAILYATRFIKASLMRASFEETNQLSSNFSEAILFNADFRASVLTETNFSSADITGCKLYGTSRDDWIIDGVKCDYVYWDKGGTNRTPPNGDFEGGEFEKIHKQLPTFDYIFDQGCAPVDTIFMDKVVQAINERNPEFDLNLESFTFRGRPRAVFTVIHHDYKEPAEKSIKQDYENLKGKVQGFQEAIKVIMESQKPQQFIAEKGDLIMMESGDPKVVKGGFIAESGAHVHDFNFNQIWNEMSTKVNLEELSQELSKLRISLKELAETPEQDKAVGEIANAELAAKEGNGPKALQHLKNSGKWCLDVAQEVGVSVAAEVLKKFLE